MYRTWILYPRKQTMITLIGTMKALINALNGAVQGKILIQISNKSLAFMYQLKL